MNTQEPTTQDSLRGTSTTTDRAPESSLTWFNTPDPSSTAPSDDEPELAEEGNHSGYETDHEDGRRSTLRAYEYWNRALYNLPRRGTATGGTGYESPDYSWSAPTPIDRSQYVGTSAPESSSHPSCNSSEAEQAAYPLSSSEWPDSGLDPWPPSAPGLPDASQPTGESIPSWEVHTRPPDSSTSGHADAAADFLMGVRILGGIPLEALPGTDLELDATAAEQLQQPDQPRTFTNHKKAKALEERMAVLAKQGRPASEPSTPGAEATADRDGLLRRVASHCRISSTPGVRLAMLALSDDSECMELLPHVLNSDLDWSAPPSDAPGKSRDQAGDPQDTFLKVPFSAPTNPVVPAPEPIRNPDVRFKFPDGATVGSIHDIITDPRACEDFKGQYLRRMHKATTPAWSHLGQHQRRRITDPMVITSEHCWERAVGYHFDCTDFEAVRERDIADARIKSNRIEWVKHMLHTHYPGGVEAYPNQSILYEMEFGIRFHRDMSWSAVISPPQANALPHLGDTPPTHPPGSTRAYCRLLDAAAGHADPRLSLPPATLPHRRPAISHPEGYRSGLLPGRECADRLPVLSLVRGGSGPEREMPTNHWLRQSA